jgi:hypothetical protein
VEVTLLPGQLQQAACGTIPYCHALQVSASTCIQQCSNPSNTDAALVRLTACHVHADAGT